MPDSLSATDARRVALRAQGLLGRAGGPNRPDDVLRQVLALQLDTISVLARSHELVCYARVGPVGRPAVEAACWGTDAAGDPVAMEYWAHAACIMPIDLWPWFSFRRRKLAGSPRWGGYVKDNPGVAEVLRRLEVEGPLTSSDLGGSKNGGPWWDWSPAKVAVERLLDLGEVICTSRRGWRRVYDLTARALPPRLAAVGSPTDDQCWRALVAMAGRAIGVGTVKDLAEYFRIPVAAAGGVVAECGLIPVAVDGWAAPAWADPAALDALDIRGRHRTTLVSPFDSLIWDRPRTERLFDFTHRLEAYTPSPERVHGYYVMPILAGGKLIGRVDPKRVGRALVARQTSLIEPFGPSQVRSTAIALREAASWVGCDSVVVERCQPQHLGPQLAAALESD
jgi:uncharacterized protein YcaQ